MSTVPPMTETEPQEQAYVGHRGGGGGGGGSVGAVIAVLAVVTILAIIAAAIGRLCSGRSIMGYGHFDVEAWTETKCSSCVDGHVCPAPSRPPLLQPRPGVAANGSSSIQALETLAEDIKIEAEARDEDDDDDEYEDDDDDEGEEESDDDGHHQHHDGNQHLHGGS
ncbi:hypothetical protein Ancab_027491 [Ancistrocladus abbreviatus]